MRSRFLLLCAWLAVFPAPGFCDDDTEDTPPPVSSGPVEPIDTQVTPPAFASVAAKLHPQHGTVTLPGGMITLNLPQELAYLSPGETEIYLRDIIGYRYKLKTMGSIIPANIAIGSPAGWNAIVNYREDGHVSDKKPVEAAGLMSQITKENEAYLNNLDKDGYRGYGVKIQGWANEPFYNASTHTLSWGFHTYARGGESKELNYHIDVLGKNGFFGMLVIAKLEQLPMLEGAARQLATIASFNAPNRYSDFTPETDKPAPYDINDLILSHIVPSQTPADAAKAKAR